jgi:hypothetical protein
MLYGKTNYGDSIEDEWVIVFLLRELSRQFHDLWIKVVDVDGEFLLAEAANALPRWLVPKVADNRVSFPSFFYFLAEHFWPSASYPFIHLPAPSFPLLYSAVLIFSFMPLYGKDLCRGALIP